MIVSSGNEWVLKTKDFNDAVDNLEQRRPAVISQYEWKTNVL